MITIGRVQIGLHPRWMWPVWRHDPRGLFVWTIVLWPMQLRVYHQALAAYEREVARRQ